MSAHGTPHGMHELQNLKQVDAYYFSFDAVWAVELIRCM